MSSRCGPRFALSPQMGKWGFTDALWRFFWRMCFWGKVGRGLGHRRKGLLLAGDQSGRDPPGDRQSGEGAPPRFQALGNTTLGVERVTARAEARSHSARLLARLHLLGPKIFALQPTKDWSGRIRGKQVNNCHQRGIGRNFL